MLGATAAGSAAGSLSAAGVLTAELLPLGAPVAGDAAGTGAAPSNAAPIAHRSHGVTHRPVLPLALPILSPSSCRAL